MGEEGDVRRAEARLLATMALAREVSGRLGVDVFGASERCRSGVEADWNDEPRL